MLRWIRKILHDPKYPIQWELWYYSILRSCKIFRINSRAYFEQGLGGLVKVDPLPRNSGDKGCIRVLLDSCYSHYDRVRGPPKVWYTLIT